MSGRVLYIATLTVEHGQSKMWYPEGPSLHLTSYVFLDRPFCSQIIHFVTRQNFLMRRQIDLAELGNLEQHEGLGLDFHEAIDIWRPIGILFPHDRDGTFCPWVGPIAGTL